MLFADDFQPQISCARTPEDGNPISVDTQRFAQHLIEGVRQHRTAIDELIQKYAEHWSLDRMTPVDRNVLRLGIFEMLYFQETPRKVAINEAIEIAKTYGAEESGAFVNGILDRIHIDHPESLAILPDTEIQTLK